VGRETLNVELDGLRDDDIPVATGIENTSCPMPWSESLFFSELRKQTSLCRAARVSGVLRGYVCAGRVLDEGHILTIAVHPEFRRKRIAALLIQDVLEKFQAGGCRAVYLEVRDSNIPARSMYEKFGFTALGTRKNYYQNPVEDAVIMVKKID
jgi:ribosomal-protein-alanine N-acetyltransferase